MDASLLFDREAFLGNETNKTRVLKHIEGKATSAGMKWEQCPADADLPIVKAALRCAEHNKHVVLVGEDTDLLVLLLHHYDPSRHGEVLLMPEEKRGPKSTTTPPANIRAIRADMANAGGLQDAILVLHALFGCDTTSSLLGLGKTKCLGKCIKHGPCRDWCRAFYADVPAGEEAEKEFKDDLLATAVKILLCTHSDAAAEGAELNAVRHQTFVSKARSNKAFRAVDLKQLPPTLASFRQHVHRIYHQVHCWRGEEGLDPERWGFKLDAANNVLAPIPSRAHLAPKALLLMFSCGCSADGVNCKDNRCTCRRHGLGCTEACGKCAGVTCENPPTVVDESADCAGSEANGPAGAPDAGASVPNVALTYDDVQKLSRERLEEEARCVGLVIGKVNGRPWKKPTLREELLLALGLATAETEAPAANAADDQASEAEDEAIEDTEFAGEGNGLGATAEQVEGDGHGDGNGGVPQDVLEAIDRELDCCYFNDMQQHMDEDEDENKEDTVAVADRLAAWQHACGSQLTLACASIADYTGRYDATAVEQHYRGLLG